MQTKKPKTKTKTKKVKPLDNRFKETIAAEHFDPNWIKGDKLYKTESGNSIVITKFPRRIVIDKGGLCFYFFFVRTLLGGSIEYLKWMVPIKYSRLSVEKNQYSIEILEDWIKKSNLKRDNWSIL